MTDYISRDGLAEHKFPKIELLGMGEGQAYRQGWNDAIDAIIDNELAADVVEVVRCKDCKHKHLENMVWACPFGLAGGENFFCGYGAEPYKGEQDG